MSSLRDTLKDVPQGSTWHPEGSVFKHTILVRKSMPVAIQMFERLRSQEGSPFSSFTAISQQDETILRLASLLHDLGKASATAYTNPDKTRTPLANYQGKYTVAQMMSPEFGQGRWQSIGHEQPYHYEPIVKQLGKQWQVILEKLSPEDKETLWFVVQRHMDLQASGIRKSLRNQMIDGDGKFLPDRKYKLWIVFKLMDVMGRGQGTDTSAGEQAMADILSAAEQKRQQKEQQVRRPPPQDKEGFTAFLRQKNIPEEQISQIVARKFP